MSLYCRLFARTKAVSLSATIRDDDACICFNFRADRVRQITRALARNSGLNAKGGSDLPGAADLDATIARDRVPKNLTLRLHDAVRQEFQPAGGDSAGVNGQYSGERDGWPQHAQPARRRDRKVCARYIFLQWRSGAAISRRRARDGASRRKSQLTI